MANFFIFRKELLKLLGKYSFYGVRVELSPDETDRNIKISQDAIVVGEKRLKESPVVDILVNMCFIRYIVSEYRRAEVENRGVLMSRIEGIFLCLMENEAKKERKNETVTRVRDE